MINKKRIFLAHAREDKLLVRDLYDRLKERGFYPWLDEVDLIPGQVWKEEIPNAIARSTVFLACLSQQSVRKRSYVQREFRAALTAYADFPPGSIFLIPVRLDDCEIPDLRAPDLNLGLADLQWVDLFDEKGFDRLALAIQQALDGVPVTRSVRATANRPRITESDQIASVTTAEPPEKKRESTLRQTGWKPIIILAAIGGIGIAITAIFGWPSVKGLFHLGKKPAVSELEPSEIATLEANDSVSAMVGIPAGAFMMGVPEEEGKEFKNSIPQHMVTIAAPFELSKFEVTFLEYAYFAAATGREEPDDRGWGRGKRPVINVSWHEADAYCSWFGRQTGKKYRLPTEAEWEYAARAGTTSRYAFGDQIAMDQARFGQDWTAGTTAEVGQYQPNDWGLFDMHGNVWEWVEDHWHRNYEGAPSDGSAWLQQDSSKRVLRGGSWGNKVSFVSSANRFSRQPDHQHHNIGFRCARDLD